MFIGIQINRFIYGERIFLSVKLSSHAISFHSLDTVYRKVLLHRKNQNLRMNKRKKVTFRYTCVTPAAFNPIIYNLAAVKHTLHRKTVQRAALYNQISHASIR